MRRDLLPAARDDRGRSGDDRRRDHAPAGRRRGPARDEADQRPVAAHRTVHEGMVWDLVRDTIDFAPGVRFDREYIRHTGAVAVLAVDEADRAC
ncbi:hypothetical protein [Brachybacterium sp. GPGPB12]|uniref:hypothetical protein n=1 Tax=Brachybacterium sp. GPGPB12 TaxID=3023517 RepID=UPI00313437DF